jgi:hypothetical protein
MACAACPEFWKEILPSSAAGRGKNSTFLLFMGADIGIGMMGLTDQYKRRAAECVRMAERTDNAEDKALLLQMAQTWMRLAEKAEERSGDK